MTVSEFVQRAYLLGQGKTSTLNTSDDKYQKFVQLGNYFKNAWAREPGVDWVSQYAVVFETAQEINLLKSKEVSNFATN